MNLLSWFDRLAAFLFGSGYVISLAAPLAIAYRHPLGRLFLALPGLV
jgi:hypothetical protein